MATGFPSVGDFPVREKRFAADLAAVMKFLPPAVRVAMLPPSKPNPAPGRWPTVSRPRPRKAA